ncbi:MAG: terminase large subunit [Gemmatimonadota bacterium]|nr:terminase large subunit [Gemmatimonadota bacterium]
MYKEVKDYIEQLIIGQGPEAGKPMRLYPWQRRFLRGALRQDDDAALTLARGGGKTTFIAAIAAAAVAGPLADPMAEVLIIASSFDQGLISFRHIQHFLAPQINADKKRWRVQDSANRATITDRETGTMLRVLGSDPRRMHGAAPKLMLLDEIAQWPHTQLDRMLAALTTARGKIEGSRGWWIGTRPASPDHPFEAQLKSKTGYVQAHFARVGDPPFQRRTWKKANPGLDYQPVLENTIRREAEEARHSPTKLAHFKALRLNMGIADTVESVLLDPDEWMRIETGETRRGDKYVLGLDLGSSAAMSAAAAYWPDAGGLESFAVFPLTPSLAERGGADGVEGLYIRCAERGELLQAGERVSDIGALLAEVVKRWGYPGAIVCDRWREAELRQVLQAASWPLMPLVARGMGYQDGGADVREFRAACLGGQVAPLESLLMRSAMAGARVTTDPAGNSKLAKGGEGRRLRSRDDAAAAAILAVAEGRRRLAADGQDSGFSYAVV